MATPLESHSQLIHGQLVVVSDVHIRTLDDDRGRLFLDSLSRLAPDVQWLVLNGDIFDFCFGQESYFREKFARLGDVLAQVAARGTRILFIEGNHEFHMQNMGWPGVTFIGGLDTTLEIGGAKIRIGHGDTIIHDRLYLAFRSLIKGRLVRACASSLPPSWLDAYAMRHARVSRAGDRYRELDHKKLLHAFNSWLDQGDYTHGIIGHYHVPYAEPRKSGAGLMLCVNMWDKPNLLSFHEGKFLRYRPAAPGQSIPVEQVRPMFPAS